MSEWGGAQILNPQTPSPPSWRVLSGVLPTFNPHQGQFFFWFDLFMGFECHMGDVDEVGDVGDGVMWMVMDGAGGGITCASRPKTAQTPRANGKKKKKIPTFSRN